MSQSEETRKNKKQYTFNLALAAVSGQVGCLTLVIILIALIGGLLLDRQFDTKPLFTVILMVGSVPVTLVMMFFIVRKATSRIKPVSKEELNPIEEEN